MYTIWMVPPGTWVSGALVALAMPIAAANWPQWRGPGAAGISEEQNLPTEWSATTNVRWKVAIPGRGHSSPIIWERRIFLTTALEGETVPGHNAPKHTLEGQEFKHPDSMGSDRRHTLKVLSLDRDTGKIIWERTAYEGTVFDDRHKKASYASSTPATDGKSLFVFFGSEGMYSYDFDGKLLWKADLGKLPQVGMGYGTSVVLDEKRVFLQCDVNDGEGSFLAALDKTTGRQVWKIPRKARISWATPLLVRAGERPLLIVSGAEYVEALDPATGKELWRAPGVQGHAIPSAVAGHGIVYLSAGYPEKRTLAVRLDAKGEVSGPPLLVWRYDKGSAYVPSPILHGDYYYLMTDRGLITCLDARTGEVKYEGGRPSKPATFSSSLVAFDDKILQTSEEGDTFVLRAGPKHEVLRVNSLGEGVYASAAVSNGMIFLRAVSHLYAIGQTN